MFGKGTEKRLAHLDKVPTEYLRYLRAAIK